MKRSQLQRKTPFTAKRVLKRKNKPVKRKEKSQSKLRKELDSVFSKYIRNKYAKNGMVACYTCPAIKPIKEMQNGHFMSRIYLNTRFDERNVRPQCAGCNIFGGGRFAEFGTKLEEENAGIVAELMREARKIHPNFPYREMIEKYNKLLVDISL